MRQNVKSISTKYYNATLHYHQMNDWKDVELKSHLTECEHLSSHKYRHTQMILANYKEMNNAKMMNLKLSITIGNVHNGPTEEEDTRPSALVILSTSFHSPHSLTGGGTQNVLLFSSITSVHFPIHPPCLSLPFFSFNRKNIFMINHHHPFLVFCDFIHSLYPSFVSENGLENWGMEIRIFLWMLW